MFVRPKSTALCPYCRGPPCTHELPTNRYEAATCCRFAMLNIRIIQVRHAARSISWRRRDIAKVRHVRAYGVCDAGHRHVRRVYLYVAPTGGDRYVRTADAPAARRARPPSRRTRAKPPGTESRLHLCAITDLFLCIYVRTRNAYYTIGKSAEVWTENWFFFFFSVHFFRARLHAKEGRKNIKYYDSHEVIVPIDTSNVIIICKRIVTCTENRQLYSVPMVFTTTIYSARGLLIHSELLRLPYYYDAYTIHVWYMYI